jgi:hypothetical protein
MEGFRALRSMIALLSLYIYERESYAMVKSVQFKILIQPLKIFSILKYVWRPNFIFFRKKNIFLRIKNRSY